MPGAPEQLEHRGLRKFRRAAGAAVDRIEHAAELARGVVELGRPIVTRAGRPRRRGEPRHQRRAVLLDLLRLLAEQPRDLAQHVDEGRPAVARALRKISAAPDRLAVGREKHGQRPAAVLAEVMQRRHVDLVDVGPLLAIDFDVDEQLVHHAPRWRRPRNSRAPSRGTSGRRRSRPRAGSACWCAWPRPAPRAPRATSRPDCPCAAADRARLVGEAIELRGGGRIHHDGVSALVRTEDNSFRRERMPLPEAGVFAKASMMPSN